MRVKRLHMAMRKALNPFLVLGSGSSGPAPTVYNFTDGLSAAEAFDTYTRASTHVIADDSGNLIEVPANAVALTGLRPVRNLWPSADGSDTPSTQTITVVSGNVYQLRIGAESASGATAVCSDAFTGTLTGDGADIQTFTAGKTATSTSLTVTITGSVRKIQLEDITHRAAVSTAPSEYVSVGVESAPYHGYGIDGLAYYATALANTVDGSGIVTEATGSAVSGALDYQPAATNLVTYSEEFDNAAWSKSRCDVTANATTAPDGTLTGDHTATNLATFDGFVAQSFSHTLGATYTVSVYAKQAERRYLIIRTLGVDGVASDVFFDLQTGAITSDTSGDIDNADAIASNNGWYRCFITYTNLVAGTYAVSFFNSEDGSSTASSDTGNGIYLWGAQAEAGAIPTAYIPTSGATASRAATTAEYTVPAANTTTFTVTGLNASLDPDPSDDTEREVEETDWSGAIGDVFTGPVQIESISVVDNT